MPYLEDFEIIPPNRSDKPSSERTSRNSTAEPGSTQERKLLGLDDLRFVEHDESESPGSDTPSWMQTWFGTCYFAFGTLVMFCFIGFHWVLLFGVGAVAANLQYALPDHRKRKRRRAASVVRERRLTRQ